jgi:PAS domain S-box-containing protein
MKLITFTTTTKLTVLMCVLIASLSVFLAWFFVKHESAALNAELAERGNTIARNVAYNCKYGVLVGDYGSLNHLIEGVLKEKDVLYVVIENTEGNGIVQAGDRKQHELREFTASITTKPFIEQDINQSPDGSNGKDEILGMVRLGISYESTHAKTAELIYLVVFVVCIASIIAFVGAALCIKMLISQPLRELLTSIREIGSGNLSHRIMVKTQDEIGEVAAAFNKMSEDLSSSYVSKTYVDNIIKSMLDSLIVVNPDGYIIKVNHSTTALLGYTKEGLIGKPFDSILVGTPFNELMFNDLMDDGFIGSVERTYRKKDRSLVPILFSASAMYDNNERIQGIVCVATDITERKQAEQKLCKTLQDLERSNKELEHFAYVASHDLQEPLRMVTSYMQLIKQRYEGKLDQNADEFIEFAVDGATRMHTMITDLLTYSRIGTRGKPFVEANCEDILKRVLSNLQIVIQNTDAVVTHDTLPLVVADKTQVTQVLQNLIANAIKFHGQKPPRVHISARDNKHDWVFSVQDNGIGIEPQYAQDIFQIFKRLHGRSEYQGTGIGLAICKKIIERHGGKIWVESTPDAGSTFFFTIKKRR